MTQNQDLMVWQNDKYQFAEVEVVGTGKPLNGKEFMKVKVVKVLPGANKLRKSITIGEICEVIVDNLYPLKTKELLSQ